MRLRVFVSKELSVNWAFVDGVEECKLLIAPFTSSVLGRTGRVRCRTIAALDALIVKGASERLSQRTNAPTGQHTQRHKHTTAVASC